jgi:hypothetical protein
MSMPVQVSATLIACLGLAACRPQAAPRSQLMGSCYDISWRDSVWEYTLPTSVRLDQRFDSVLSPAYSQFHLLVPARPANSVRWAGLMNAWWIANANDSLTLVFSSVDASWTAHLGVKGDSLWGTASYIMGRDSSAFPVQAVRRRCPDAKAGA